MVWIAYSVYAKVVNFAVKLDSFDERNLLTCWKVK